MSELPESNFRFRRIFSYTISVVLLALLAVIVWQLDQAEELADVALWIIILLWWVVTFYMVSPSAEQIVRIIQAAKLFGRDK